MAVIFQDRAQRGAHRILEVVPENVKDPARRGVRRTLDAALVPWVMFVHLLQATDKLRVGYPWSTPTAAEVVANYSRGLILQGRPGSRRVPFLWRSFPARAVITSQTAKVPKGKVRAIRRRGELEVRFDQDFEEIIHSCRDGRVSWITPGLIDVYRELHRLGFVATVGTYRDGRLVGGFWGIGIGRVFSIMSMFHREDHAGALALAALVDLVSGDDRWSVIDCGGSVTRHFAMYGANQISEQQFCELVWSTLSRPVIVPG